ncbi:MAG: ABC transporter ATP-binding protein [Acidimicrobiia bacterium]
MTATSPGGPPVEPATDSSAAPDGPLLEVRGLRVEFSTHAGTVRAVNGVSLSVRRGETLAIVGESGSGKTVTALSIMGLVDRPGSITGGEIVFEGVALQTLPEREYRRFRGGDLAMIFQDPLSSLNPAFRVGDQIAEALLQHSYDAKSAARRQAAHLLDIVGIPQAADRARDYPHQLSGGMRQRAMIAMAIANKPALLIADEPTTALDVTIQAQVLEVLRAAQAETNAALLLITHDLGIVAGMADRIVVMYAGRIVEEGDLDEIFSRSRHPYTLGLLGSLPRLDSDRRKPLPTIPGTPPSLLRLPPGCALAPRCPYVVDHCREERPELDVVEVGTGHRSACWRAAELPELEAAKR